VAHASIGLQTYVGVCFPPFFIQMMLMGLISGVGIQSETQIPAIICFIFICIPSAWYLTFTLHMGMKGIFYGQAFGQVILTVMYFKICHNIDWQAQVEIIKEQNKQVEDIDEDSQGLLSSIIPLREPC
jgi:Na+-driven multidrug efflux pump